MKTGTVAALVVLGGALLLLGLTVIGIARSELATARMIPFELATIQEIQIIQSAQEQYKSQFGKYASTLAELGPPASGSPDPKAANLIPKSLVSGERDGYVFALTATPTGYTINANPKVYKRTGRRTFYSDQTLHIYQNWSGEPANASSSEYK